MSFFTDINGNRFLTLAEMTQQLTLGKAVFYNTYFTGCHRVVWVPGAYTEARKWIFVHHMPASTLEQVCEVIESSPRHVEWFDGVAFHEWETSRDREDNPYTLSF